MVPSIVSKKGHEVQGEEPGVGQKRRRKVKIKVTNSRGTKCKKTQKLREICSHILRRSWIMATDITYAMSDLRGRHYFPFLRGGWWPLYVWEGITRRLHRENSRKRGRHIGRGKGNKKG